MSKGNDGLTDNLSTLAATQNKNDAIHKKLAIGMVAATTGIMGIGVTAAIASDIMKDNITSIEPKQEESIQTTTLGDETSISKLEEKLEDIRVLLEGKQNIKLDINNKIKYDSWSDSNPSYTNSNYAVEATSATDFA